jgi:hypothetical protein
MARLAPALVPAFAVLVAVLAYPAWQGLVEYPALERRQAATAHDLETLRKVGTNHQNAPPGEPPHIAAPESAGPARLLYLAAQTRGADSAPHVTLFPGQLYQPIVIEHRPFSERIPRGSVSLRITRLAGGVTTWSEERRVTEVWDSTNSSLVLLVPASALPPGEYTLEVERNGAVTYHATFVTSLMPDSASDGPGRR